MRRSAEGSCRAASGRSGSGRPRRCLEADDDLNAIVRACGGKPLRRLGRRGGYERGGKRDDEMTPAQALAMLRAAADGRTVSPPGRPAEPGGGRATMPLRADVAEL